MKELFLSAKITIHPIYFIAFIILFILKVTRVINWSWFWITSPIWFAGLFGFSMFIVACFLWIIKNK